MKVCSNTFLVVVRVRVVVVRFAVVVRVVVGGFLTFVSYSSSSSSKSSRIYSKMSLNLLCVVSSCFVPQTTHTFHFHFATTTRTKNRTTMKVCSNPFFGCCPGCCPVCCCPGCWRFSQIRLQQQQQQQQNLFQNDIEPFMCCFIAFRLRRIWLSKFRRRRPGQQQQQPGQQPGQQ
jgi:hypothetical protein